MCLLEGLCEQRGERGPPSQALTPIRGGLPRLGCTACWEAGETNYPWAGRMLCTLFRAAWNLLDSPDFIPQMSKVTLRGIRGAAHKNVGRGVRMGLVS